MSKKTMQDMTLSSSSGFDYDITYLQSIVDDILKQAAKHGASSAEAAVSSQHGYSVTVRKAEVETIEYNRDKGLGVTVYFGQSKGSASTTDFKAAAIKATVQAACDIARYTSADEAAGLADPALLATDIPDLALYQPWALAPEQAIELATECESAGFAVDPRLTNSEGAYVSTHSGQRFYGNSLGFMGGFASSRHSLGCTLIASGDGEMQRDYWYSIARNPEQLEDIRQVGQMAGERTVRRLNARKLGTARVPVLFSADVARGLMGHLARAVSGGSLYREASFLLDARGKPIFPDFVQMDERPHLLQGLGSAPFDNEGVRTQPRTLVESGVLQGYVLDSYAARRLGMQSTGNAGGGHNLHIRSTGQSLADLLKEMNTGLLVTEVMGQGVNIVTGDYSRGASGFWVENGEIQYPVEEITLAGKLPEMFLGLQAVGRDVDTRGNLLTGSWLIDAMTVAGN